MPRKIIFIATVIAVVTFLSGWLLHGIMLRTDKTTTPEDFNNANISGRFILAQSSCAGFNFINTTTVLWTNEIACDDPDTLKIRWLDNKTFMTKSTVRVNESCPPKVDIYKVISFDGKHLSLKSVATGWNDSDDAILDFTKQGY